MNTLRNHVLHEVEQLDVKSLLALQSIVAALKTPATAISHCQRGVGAARCRNALAGLKISLSQTIMEAREDRL